jgi:serine/threonine-protein kinase
MEHDPDRWQRVDQLFHAALARQESERKAFLDAECAGDQSLQREVESLLAQEDATDDFRNTIVEEPSARPPVPLPEQIRHYKILDKLGEGGMGVVYVAEDQRLGRRVALKVLRADSNDPNARNRLVREARLAAGVSHPLICQIFGWESGRQPFIAMELLSGEPLAAPVDSSTPPSEAFVLPHPF